MGIIRVRAVVYSTFNVQKILRAQRQQEVRRLRRAGAFVRQTAQQSLTTSKGPSTPAGRPPRSHTRTLKRSIKFAVDAGARRVLIGPEALGTAAGAQALQAIEFGGWSHTVRRNRRQKRIKLQPHPFMGPALVKETPNLPAIWQG